MNWAAIIAIVSQVAQLAPQIIKAYETAPGVGLDKIAAIIKGSPVVQTLEAIGAALWPKAAPALHAAAAALLIAHPNAVSWAQSSLNLLQAAKVISFGPDLVVDGYFGPKTFAAVEALQVKVGIKPNGMITDAEYAAISAALAKL